MRPLYLLAIDGVGYHPLRRWIGQGRLPYLKELVDSHSRRIQLLENKCLLRTENAWLTFAQALPTIVSQEWAHCHYDAATYSYTENPSYRFDRVGPFFREKNYSSLVFDMPLVDVDMEPCVATKPQRVEIYGWGTEANQASQSSFPPEELPRINTSFGQHPVYSTRSSCYPSASDSNGFPHHNALSQYRLPNIYRRKSLVSLRDGLVSGVRLRTEIITDLLKIHNPSLAICTYAEGHTAGHMFWHLSQPHPLNVESTTDLLLDVIQEIDHSIGKLAKLFANADFIIFSPQGMQVNFIELSSSVFLPEILFRFSGDGWLLGGDQSACLRIDPSGYVHWRDIIYRLINPSRKGDIDSPLALDRIGDAMNWSPARWYRPLWAEMKAFALPSYSEGLIRLNVEGRDGEGLGSGHILENHYDDRCEEIISELLEWKDVVSGKRIVSNVLRTRSSPSDRSGPYGMLPADLIVQWRESVISNHICHPRKGQIGPLPYFRTGSHCCQGMVIDLSLRQVISQAQSSRISLPIFARLVDSYCSKNEIVDSI